MCDFEVCSVQFWNWKLEVNTASITDGLHVFPHAASKITFAHVPRARETRNFKPCGATSLCVVVLSLEGTAAPVEWLRD